MNTAFTYPIQTGLARHKTDPVIAPIMKDIDNARQGVMSFSKEVKKYMLQFIHARYDGNEEVTELISVLKRSSAYQSFNDLEIFKLQDESYFWYDFLHFYALYKIIEASYGFTTEEEAEDVLVRICKQDVVVFKEYPNI